MLNVPLINFWLNQQGMVKLGSRKYRHKLHLYIKLGMVNYLHLSLKLFAYKP